MKRDHGILSGIVKLLLIFSWRLRPMILPFNFSYGFLHRNTSLPNFRTTRCSVFVFHLLMFFYGIPIGHGNSLTRGIAGRLQPKKPGCFVERVNLSCASSPVVLRREEKYHSVLWSHDDFDVNIGTGKCLYIVRVFTTIKIGLKISCDQN
jgi:hypothetical protein